MNHTPAKRGWWYRGQHHLRRGALRVADIKAAIDREQSYWQWRGILRVPSAWTPADGSIYIAPPEPPTNFPALVKS